MERRGGFGSQTGQHYVLLAALRRPQVKMVVASTQQFPFGAWAYPSRETFSKRTGFTFFPACASEHSLVLVPNQGADLGIECMVNDAACGLRQLLLLLTRIIHVLCSSWVP